MQQDKEETMDEETARKELEQLQQDYKVNESKVSNRIVDYQIKIEDLEQSYDADGVSKLDTLLQYAIKNYLDKSVIVHKREEVVVTRYRDEAAFAIEFSTFDNKYFHNKFVILKKRIDEINKIMQNDVNIRRDNSILPYVNTDAAVNAIHKLFGRNDDEEEDDEDDEYDEYDEDENELRKELEDLNNNQPTNETDEEDQDELEEDDMDEYTKQFEIKDKVDRASGKKFRISQQVYLIDYGIITLLDFKINPMKR